MASTDQRKESNERTPKLGLPASPQAYGIFHAQHWRGGPRLSRPGSPPPPSPPPPLPPRGPAGVRVGPVISHACRTEPTPERDQSGAQLHGAAEPAMLGTR